MGKELSDIEAIVIIYRELLEDFDILQEYAIDAQIEANDMGRAYLQEIENLAVAGKKLLEKYKEPIIEFESTLEPNWLKSAFRSMLDDLSDQLKSINADGAANQYESRRGLKV